MRLAAVGDNCIDYYAQTNSAYAGGNPVNVAVYFKRLGGTSSYIGVVGDDKYGEFMIKQIKSKGVDTSHIDILKGNTAVTQVELVNGERILNEYDEGVLENFKLTKAQKDFILEHDMLSTGLWGNIHNDLKFFKEKGILIAFDAATRPFDEASLIAMQSADYFFFAIDDYNKSNLDKLKEDMKKILSKGAKQVITTLGEYGSLVYDGKKFTSFGIIECDVIDTMGAGDSFIAGYLKGILDKKNTKECMEIGARNASETIGYEGAW